MTLVKMENKHRIGANNKFEKEGNRVNLREVEGYVAQENYEWVFNPPHASHAGGVWERMIGVVRRVLDAVLSPTVKKHLTHKVLTTLMAEASAIVKATSSSFKRPYLSRSSHTCYHPNTEAKNTESPSWEI